MEVEQALENESLDLVVTEMRQREVAQDGQATVLSTKASFLFTAGTASIAASAALAGSVLDASAVDAWRLVWPVAIAGGAYLWLVISFTQAYRVRAMKRTANPDRLIEFSTLPPAQAKDFLSDGRRKAIQTNDWTLGVIAKWVNHELVSLIVVIGALIGTLITVAFG